VVSPLERGLRGVLMNRINKAQVSDTTKDNNSTTAKFIKIKDE
jgi:hypothetical protein